MKITVRYFAALREALGPGETLDVPAPLSVQALRERLSAQTPTHAGMLGPGRAVRASVNRVMAAPDTDVPDRAEVGFFPPVTGG